MTSQEYCKIAVAALEDRKAEDVKIIDIREISPVADYFVIMEAMNSRQLDAIADNIAEAAELAGAKAAGHIEGDAKTGWVLIDLGDIVVSVFGHDERGHFNLEKLWSDAPMVDISGFMAE